MPLPEGSPRFRSGYVAVVGPPNAGKSTLVNAWLQQSLAPVSPRPQTTIRTLLGILTLPSAQVIFVDTPGIHQPLHRLGESMVNAARSVLRDADLALVVFDASRSPGAEETLCLEALANEPAPPLFAVNKIDLVPAPALPERLMAYQRWVGAGWVFPVSAQVGTGIQALLEKILEHLPDGPMYFEEDSLTDSYERDIAADLIRAACLDLLREEVPYQIAVRIDAYQEPDPDHARIEATLLTEKESHKAIVIGKGGQMIKRIGTLARERIQQMSGRQVYLGLRVKTLPGWRSNDRLLSELGYRSDRK
ncbi:MAG: GTPase Era [Anaerolineales bacterium]|nr:GTPase Era [Anaerolineales bacterium]